MFGKKKEKEIEREEEKVAEPKAKPAAAAAAAAADAVIEGMADAVTILDLDGTIRQVNSEFERGTGWKREEIVGKTSIELGIMTKEEGQRVEIEIMPKLMKEGFVRNIETVGTRRDGTKFPVLMSWTLMKDVEGNPTGIITVARDITELKRLQEKEKAAAAENARAEEAEKYSKELEKKIRDLETFQKVTMDREKRVIELKDKIWELEKRLKEKG